MSTRIVTCTCRSEYQDSRYGVQRRVANTLADAYNGARCTVCGSVVGKSGATHPKKDSKK